MWTLYQNEMKSFKSNLNQSTAMYIYNMELYTRVRSFLRHHDYSSMLSGLNDTYVSSGS